MTKRKSRKSIVYRPKGKGKGRVKAKANGDGGEDGPSDRAWNEMHLFGAFSKSFKVDDNNDDNQKYRFRRGDIATILPSHKTPGEPIEPHEYWVGKILEIRADQGSVDSEQIWTKVQWLYSIEEAKDLIPSLDLSLFGKFERIWSDHWNFVYPHAFNEVITLPQLLTFPHTSPIPILQHPHTPNNQRGQRRNRQHLQQSREVSLLSSSTSSTLTTITTATSSTTMTTVTSGSNQSIFGVPPTLQDLMAQRVIGPETFYWRYTLSVEERILGPTPISDSNCICSYPYRPDDGSLRGGVMIYCPRRGCGTGYHLGCLEDVNCVWVDEKKKCGGRKCLKGKGKGKGKEKIDVEETQDEEEEEEEERWLSKRAIRQISTSPNSNDAYIDLLSLLTSQPPSTKTPTQQKRTKRGEMVLSLLERVYDRQLEQHYIYSQSESSSSQPRQKGKTKKLTANSLLATLFILPPPYPLLPSPIHSKRHHQRRRQRQQQCELHLLLAVACQPLFRGGGCFDGLGPTGNVNAVICAREFVWEVVSRVGELDLGGGLVRERRRGGGRGGNEEEEEEEQERKDREDFARIRECVEIVLDGYRKRFFSSSTMDVNNNNNENIGGCSGSHDGKSTGPMKDLVVPVDGEIEDAIVVKKGLLFFDYLHRSSRKRSSSGSTLTSDMDEDGDGDTNEDGVLAGDMRLKDEPLSDIEIVEETEQEEEGMWDDDGPNTSADEIDNILLASPGKRKRSTTVVTRRKRNHSRMRKKFKTGAVMLGFGEGDDSDSDDDDEEDEDEEEEEDIEDVMLLNADWACPGCRGSI